MECNISMLEHWILLNPRARPNPGFNFKGILPACPCVPARMYSSACSDYFRVCCRHQQIAFNIILMFLLLDFSSFSVVVQLFCLLIHWTFIGHAWSSFSLAENSIVVLLCFWHCAFLSSFPFH